MVAVLVVALGFLLVVIAIAILFLVYKTNKLKNKVEDTVIDGVKQVIIAHGPEAVKYVKNKIEKK
jgi:hypothetical protein